MSFKHKRRSKLVLTMLLHRIRNSEFDQLEPLCRILIGLLHMRDERYLQLFRVRLVENEFFMIMNKFKRYPKFTKEMICFLLDIRAAFPGLVGSHADWTWVAEWMRGHAAVYRDFPPPIDPEPLGADTTTEDIEPC